MERGKSDLKIGIVGRWTMGAFLSKLVEGESSAPKWCEMGVETRGPETSATHPTSNLGYNS